MSEIIGHLLAAGQRAEVFEGGTRVVTSSWAQAIRVRRGEPELDKLLPPFRRSEHPAGVDLLPISVPGL